MIGHACNAWGSATQWTSSSGWCCLAVEWVWLKPFSLHARRRRWTRTSPFGVTSLDFFFSFSFWRSTSSTKMAYHSPYKAPPHMNAPADQGFLWNIFQRWVRGRRLGLPVVAPLFSAVGSAAVRGDERRKKTSGRLWVEQHRQVVFSCELRCFWLTAVPRCRFSDFSSPPPSVPGVSRPPRLFLETVNAAIWEQGTNYERAPVRHGSLLCTVSSSRKCSTCTSQSLVRVVRACVQCTTLPHTA